MLKYLSTWADEPMLEGFMSLTATRGYEDDYSDKICIEVTGGIRPLLAQAYAIPDTPGTTLSQVLDQKKDDGYNWQLELPLSTGLNSTKSINDWSEDPLIQALMSQKAEIGVDSNNNPAILICIPNECMRILLTQGAAIAAPPVIPSTTLSQVLDENKNDPHHWYLNLDLVDGDWGMDKLSNWINNPVISGFMSLPAILVEKGIDIVTEEHRFGLLHYDY